MGCLIRIVAPHFVAGIIYQPTIDSICAPIVKYMKDWHIIQIESYCERKGWKMEVSSGSDSGEELD